jgi:uncharacterized membrane protein YvlD (DUF360 family)
MTEMKNEYLTEEFHDFINKFYKHIMYASIFILIIGTVISSFLSILKLPIAALAFYCFVFGIFMGLISAEALLRKLVGEKE